ncbi:MAG: patatin-like phospholipase family protein [Gammaproteobacteria bacterium]|nr:patatin-like phospholipase family protein [Gammaproteobacteria bacterium]
MKAKLTVQGRCTARPIAPAPGRAVLACLLGGLLACGARPAASQEPGAIANDSRPARPRIGLVLSGGGARGAAHVGVLKTLEALHVPVDAIAGTSMGAVVGGLYASGMSAAEIEKELDTIDWEDAFRDRPQRSRLNFRRKLEDRDFLVQLPLGFREGRFQLPRGLIQGQKLTQLLRELTLPVSHVASFDALPTAFRAVATDLETGAAVTLKDGDLASALRASLSAPGIFAPVEREGRLLVDGGIADNLPIAVIREMNVDRLIVVDVGNPLLARDNLDDVTTVANQMIAIMVRREGQKQLATLSPDDVVITPEMPRVSSYDFSSLPKAMRLGEQAAVAQQARLAGLSVSPAEYAAYLAAREHPVSVPTIREVRVAAESAGFARQVDDFFGALENKPLDQTLLRRRANRYYGQGLLESLDYRLLPVPDDSGRSDMEFQVRPNSWGPTYVRFGLRLQDDFRGNTSFDAATRVLFTELNALGAEWIWDAQVGGNPRLGTQLYLPLSPRRRWFIEPTALFQIRAVPEYDDDELQVGELRVRSIRFGGSLGREMGQSAELRAGLEREIGQSRVRLGDVSDPPLDFTNNELFTRFTYDSLDSVAFPRSGEGITAQWRRQLSGRSLDRVSDSISLDVRIARSWGRNTFIAWGSAGTLLNDEFADVRSYFPLGGFLNLSGISANSLSGPHYSIGRLVYYRKVGSGGEGFLNVPMYAGMSLEAGNTWTKRTDMSLSGARKDMSLFFGLDTFVGPAWFAIGLDSHGKHAFYLSVGRGF